MKPILQSLKPIVFTFILTVFFSCKKEQDTSPIIIPDNNSNPWGTSINLDISGKVLDDATGNPVIGATVKAGSDSTTTDINGIFFLKNAPASSSLALVQVIKSGYFNGSRSFLPLSGGGNLRIRLLPKTPMSGSISVTGGTLCHSSGAELTLEANSVTKNGVAYSGNVKVCMQYIDPTTEDFDSRMPGDLIALDGNTTLGLKSFGMLGVELQDESGEELQIATGKKAKLKFPIPASLLAVAADSIDLWSYDEAKGYWIKEGQAVKEGNFYYALVGHFSFWNCDAPFPIIKFDGRILTNNKPLAGALITISSEVSGSRNVYTNSDGSFGGSVPKGEVLALKVEAGCGNTFSEVYSENIGPFASNASLESKNVLLTNATFVSGKISGCNNSGIRGAYVMVDGQGAYFGNEAGNFSFSTCGTGNVNLIAYGGNPWTQSSSKPINLNGSNVIVNFQVCVGGATNSSVTDIDGNAYDTVRIGTQVWMKENLKVSRYRNGVAIPTGLNNTSWSYRTSGACANYSNNVFNSTTYGKLYNFYAVADPSGLCPAGWHVPTDAEWYTLENYLDPSVNDPNAAGFRGTDVGAKLKAVSSLWASPNLDATNSSGFTALPGGYRGGNGVFNTLGDNGYWWSSTQNSSAYAWIRNLNFNNANSYRNISDKKYGFSVRCLKD